MALFPAIINNAANSAYQGKVVQIGSNGAVTIGNILTATQYSGGTQGTMAFIDRNIRASKVSGSTSTYTTILHADGTYNTFAGITLSNEPLQPNDILIWTSGSIIFSDNT